MTSLNWIKNGTRFCRSNAFNRRYFARSLHTSTQKEKTSKFDVYANAKDFRSNSDLARHLEDNILFFEPSKAKYQGLLVLNKPYGIPLKEGETSTTSFEKALPILADRLQIKDLKVIKSCGRFVSGPMLLSTKTDDQLKRINLLRTKTKEAGALHEKYLVITDGSPLEDEREECADLHLEKAGHKKLDFRGKQCYEVRHSHHFDL